MPHSVTLAPLTLADHAAVMDLWNACEGVRASETPAELARMRAAVKPVAERFSAEYDPAKVKLFNAELERIQKIN